MIMVLLDGNKIMTRAQLHESLKKQLKFPDYYGKNLDALYDCLTDLSSALPISIVWENFENSKVVFGDYANKVLEVFFDAKDFLKDFGELKIETK